MVDGLRPCIPGIKPFAVLIDFAAVVPERGLAPGGTGYPCPGGEDHLKRRRRVRRIVPSPPVPPLLGYRHCPRRQTEFFSCASVARVQCRGAGGEAPGEINFWAPPSRREGGQGGWGKKQAKGRVGRQSQPPSPPSGTTAARSASAARVQRRGAGGEAPGEINFWAPPFPPGRGAGGMGEKSKPKAGQGGNPNRQVPLQAPQRQGYPAPQGQALPPPPPPGTGLAASARNRKENTPAGNNRRGCS